MAITIREVKDANTVHINCDGMDYTLNKEEVCDECICRLLVNCPQVRPGSDLWESLKSALSNLSLDTLAELLSTLGN